MNNLIKKQVVLKTLFLAITFHIILVSCTKIDLPKDQNVYYPLIKIQNTIVLNYKEKVSIDSILQTNGTNQYKCNTTDFVIENNKFYLKDPNNLSVTKSNIILTDVNSKKSYLIKLSFKFWISGKYNLKPIQNESISQFIYTSQDTTFSIENDQLYYSIKEQDNKILCSNLKVIDPMYNQMVCKFGLYAFRTGGNIYISKNLKNWKKIYSGKRGIKESMVIVQNDNGYELLFSEYTPGTVYVRHYIRSYNFNTETLSIRQTFYTDADYSTSKLTPLARHIHFLVQDPYSDLIFTGTGDSDTQSAIYYSNDKGTTFKRMGGGSQKWRSLSMIFTKNSIFWNMDSPSTQYLIRLNKSDLQENVSNSKLSLFPLINSALWCSEKIPFNDANNKTEMIIMSSNNEGGLFDDNFRNYGIIIQNEEPVVYELFSRKAQTIYSQLYPIGTDYNGNLLLLDLETMKTAKYKVVLK